MFFSRNTVTNCFPSSPNTWYCPRDVFLASRLRPAEARADGKRHVDATYVVLTSHTPQQYMYPQPPVSVYTAAVPYISPAQVPIPPTPAEPAVIPPMPSSSTTSSRSSTPSTLRTTRDYPLPSLDMPHMTATFPMPQPQFFAPTTAPATPFPMFMQPTMQMAETPVPTVLPVIPPTPSDTTSSPVFTTRSVNLDNFPLPADFAKMPEPASVQATPAALATPRLQSPEPVVPPQPVPEEPAQLELEPVAKTIVVDASAVPEPTTVVDPALSTPMPIEVPVVPVVPEAVEVPVAPVTPAPIEADLRVLSPAVQPNVIPSPSVTVYEQPRSASPAYFEPTGKSLSTISYLLKVL